jgi:hypothetical protein
MIAIGIKEDGRPVISCTSEARNVAMVVRAEPRPIAVAASRRFCTAG